MVQPARFFHSCLAGFALVHEPANSAASGLRLTMDEKSAMEMPLRSPTHLFGVDLVREAASAIFVARIRASWLALAHNSGADAPR